MPYTSLKRDGDPAPHLKPMTNTASTAPSAFKSAVRSRHREALRRTVLITLRVDALENLYGPLSVEQDAQLNRAIERLNDLIVAVPPLPRY